MNIATVIVKVTHECNLACRYCYATDRKGKAQRKNIMSLETLENMIRRVAAYGEKAVHFILFGMVGNHCWLGENFMNK